MKSRNKIIGIGWHKTGTTTLESMLEILGYRVCNFDNTLLKPALEKNFDLLFKWARPWDAVSDVPWFILYKELDGYFPGSKFIMTIRDENDWLQSVQRYLSYKIRLSSEYIYGLKDPLQKPDVLIRQFRLHYQEVMEYFCDRPEDLLVVDWKKDGWEKLCEFLGHEVPKTRFGNVELNIPWKNKASVVKKRKETFYNRRIVNSKTKIRLKLVEKYPNSTIALLNFQKFIRKSIKSGFNQILYKT